MSGPAPDGAGWTLAVRLARRELRGGLRGFRVFLACLALGVAAIAAVGSVSEALLGGLRDNGRALLGGDLDLRLAHRTASVEQHDWLAARGALSEVVHMRAMARTDARRSLIELRAVDALYPLYGAVRLDPPAPLDEALAFRNGAWGTAVDAQLLGRLDLAAADMNGGPRIRIGEAEYEVRAVIEQEPDRTARFAAFGPHVLVAGASLADAGLLQPGSMIHYHYRLRLPEGGDGTEVRQDLTAAFPDAGWRIRDPHEAAPGVKRFVERLALFLSLVGQTALLVGGLGVGNAVRSYLERRTPTIATLKCLGAPGRLIFRVYLIQVMTLAAGGIVAGQALGAGAPFVVDLLLGATRGWRPAAGIFAAPIAVAAAFGLLTALAFSLWPLARARAVPAASLFRDMVAPTALPHGALERRTLGALAAAGAALAGLAVVTAADRWLGLYFVAGALGAFVLFRLATVGIVALARRGARLRRPWLRLALANLHRPGAPTGSVVLSLGLGVTVLVAVALVEGNLAREVEQRLPAEAPEFYFIDIQPQQVADFERLVRETPGARALERVPMLRGRITAVNGRGPDEIEVPPDIAWVFQGDRGLTWAARPPEGAEIVAGRWWPADYGGAPLVSLDAAVGEALGLAPGDRLGINVLGREVEVEIANLRVVEWSRLGINFVMIFSPGLLESAPQSHIATVKADGAAADALERAVVDTLPNVSAIRVKEALGAVADLLRRIAAAVRVIAGVALAAGILVLAGAVAAGHRRRVYDAVVLKVLGATRPVVARAFLLEYGLLGLVTAAIATGLGSLAAYLVMTRVMHLPFAFLPGMAFGTAAIAVAITLTLGLAGTWRALGQKAAPLLRNK
jgi:putative ABC transport system permease protein